MPWYPVTPCFRILQFFKKQAAALAYTLAAANWSFKDNAKKTAA
jgi:hypothetical protein